jgi:hypothetical protein
LLFEPKLDPNLQAWAWVHACGNPTKPWNLEYTLTGSWSEVAIFGAQNVAKVQVFFTCTTRIMASRAHIALSQKKLCHVKGPFMWSLLHPSEMVHGLHFFHKFASIWACGHFEDMVTL